MRAMLCPHSQLSTCIYLCALEDLRMMGNRSFFLLLFICFLFLFYIRFWGTQIDLEFTVLARMTLNSWPSRDDRTDPGASFMQGKFPTTKRSHILFLLSPASTSSQLEWQVWTAMPGSSVSPAFQLVYIGGPTSDHHGGATSGCTHWDSQRSGQGCRIIKSLRLTWTKNFIQLRRMRLEHLQNSGWQTEDNYVDTRQTLGKKCCAFSFTCAV